LVFHPDATGPYLQDSCIGQAGPIPDASIGYLKGAARLTTAIAAVVCCKHHLGVEVRSNLVEGKTM